jgi:hypothetical protein
MKNIPRRPFIAALGYTAFGAALSLSPGFGPQPLVGAMAAPLACALALLSLLPALYIVTTLGGSEPPLDQALRAARGTLEDVGMAMLGLAPAAAFLVLAWRNAAVLVAVPAIALAARVCAASLSRRMFEGGTLVGRALVMVWAALVCSLAITLVSRWTA